MFAEIEEARSSILSSLKTFDKDADVRVSVCISDPIEKESLWDSDATSHVRVIDFSLDPKGNVTLTIPLKGE